MHLDDHKYKLLTTVKILLLGVVYCNIVILPFYIFFFPTPAPSWHFYVTLPASCILFTLANRTLVYFAKRKEGYDPAKPI
jgi:ABC-type polysaccharide/polyol phosphate export permease